MADVDVARSVEEAKLGQMSAMDIDDVYTLMDVQLRERPDARELYRRWEKQNWSAYDIDLRKDAEDWKGFPADFKDQLMLGFRGFFLGEAAVTDTLSPMVHAAPTDEDRQFLSTQLVDEARHTVFFDRFFREVLGEAGLDAAKEASYEMGYTRESDRGYSKLFYKDLVEVTDAVRLDPADYGKWVDSIVLYHLLIETMLALPGQRRITKILKTFDVLPGFRAGFTAITRDESRHVNYGTYALWCAVRKGLHDRIVDTAMAYVEPTCDVISIPFRKIPPVPPALAKQFPFREGWEFSVIQLRKRFGNAGVSEEAQDAVAARWWARIEENLDDYEERYGEPHPARVQQAEAVA